MSNQETGAPVSDEKDDELEQLLDSALQDFEKPPPKKSPLSELQTPTDEKSAECSAEQLWNDEFLLDAQKQFEQNLKTLFDQDDEMSSEQFGEHIQKLAEETSRVLTEHSDDPNFSSTIAETLRNISENSECLQGELGDDISSLLEGLNLSTGEGGTTSDILPFMQNMMQSFLSKQVLYPCVKEIVDKYPGWLESKKDSLPEKEYENFKKQYDIMVEVCAEFEKETPNDSNETKKMRFTKILTLMENMQKLGHPPKELIEDGSPFTFDQEGMPNPLPGLDSSQCSIM